MAQFTTHFTVTEARATLPGLRRRLLRIHDLLAELRAQSDHADTPPPIVVRGNGKGPIVTQATGATREEAQTLIEGIAAQGIQIKDLARGLVDFPHYLGGDPQQEVFLCWHLGEDTIGYWHGIHDGFGGRRAL